MKKYRSGTKRNKQILDLDMVEITLSTLDENPDTSTNIHAGSEKRLNSKHISPLQGVLQWPNTPEIKFKRNTESCHL